VAASASSASPITFDVFELDPNHCQLRRNGLPVDVAPQALKILTLLASRPNELVTRAEVKDALWPGQSFGDFDSRLNFTMKKLREALRDSAEQPRYVQTVRNSGYRFIAPLRTTSAPEAVAVAAPPSAPRGLHSFSSNPTLMFMLAVITISTVVFALSAARPGVRIPSIHVSPVDDSVPALWSVTTILPQPRQRIIIKGKGFGMHVPYEKTDSPYLAIRDQSSRWAAGRLIPQNWDEVMLDVEKWTDTEIVVSGFSGSYGANGWQLLPGDELEIAVWNPQTGAGPARFRTKVSTQRDAGALKTQPHPTT